MQITITSQTARTQVECESGENLLRILQRGGYEISAPCGGNGKCGKCAITLICGETTRTVLACHTAVTAPCEVILPSALGTGLITDGEEIATSEEGYGLALDIGTTTLAFYFVDLRTGKTVKTLSRLNPQQSFGADVISRIGYATTSGVNALTDCIRQAVQAEAEAFLKEHNLSCLKRTVIAANTVMLHAFAGKDLATFGYSPFTPHFLQTTRYGGNFPPLGGTYSLSLLGEITLLPSAASFLGADVVCGAVATNLAEKTALLVDLGTNGEIILSKKGEFFATSVAAGPAFEGADIECGKGGVKGAISRVSANGYQTIGNAPADGICGSGLVDAVAVMLKKGIIDETGAFCEGDRFNITKDVYLSQKDVRKFQLAKSAVRSGIELLLKRANLTYDDVEALLVAGGLGYYISRDSACAVGLFPFELCSRITAVGNTAGLGAKRCLLSPAAITAAEEIAEKTTVIDLSKDADFTDAFAENMFF